MNNFETKQNTEPRKYYVKKPSSSRDFIFLEAVNKLMAIWDKCGSNRLDKLVEILEQMRDVNHSNRFICNELINMFKSANNGFVGKAQGIHKTDVNYNSNLPFFVWLLDGEQRYKMIKEILPFMRDPVFMSELLVISEFATLEDIRDAFKVGIDIDKKCIGAFRNALFKEYNQADAAKRIHINNLVQDIVFCIEHYSYMDNKQCVQNMYKQFGISGQQIKKADFKKSGESVINQDVIKIIEQVKAHTR